MKAIFKDRNKQYTAAVGDVIAVDLMDNVSDDDELTFDEVLMICDEDKSRVGDPVVKDAKVKATVLENYTRDKKVVVFKYKRKKNYKRTKGHKQPYTVIKIESID